MTLMIDTFTFFDELELLEFRLKELDSVVDYFVLVESDLTFSGLEKHLVFGENKHRFSGYSDRIIHVVHEASREARMDAWGRESAQRNAILEGLSRVCTKAEDFVIISDCDEVPRSDLLAQIGLHGFDIFSDPANEKYLNNLGPFSPDDYNFEDEIFGFLQDHYYYNLECKHADSIWWQSRILTYRKLLEIEQPNRARRLDIGEQYYGHAGWHFSFFGGRDSIINKIKSYSHQEYNAPEFLAEDNIEGAILTKQDLFGRDNIKLTHLPLESNDNLPAHYEMLLKLG